MITVVLDATSSLGDSEIYMPLLYRSMRNETCFYIRNEEVSKINKIKSIIKYYPKNDYEIVILLDMLQSGESLIEKIYQINKTILMDVFSEVKIAAKIRYLVLDYINTQYLLEEKNFLKNIEEIQTEYALSDVLNKINNADNKITWTEELVDVEFFNVKDLFIEKVLLRAEIDLIEANKMPNEEKEDFLRNIYLKVYGFINLIADNTIEEDLTACCYQEVPIYNLVIALNEDAIQECAKRYLLNIENEDKKLDLNLIDKIEYANLYEENESDDKEQENIINRIRKTKLQLKRPWVSFFSQRRDLKKLSLFVEKAKYEYKANLKILKTLHNEECQKVRNALNNDLDYAKTEYKERLEIENKIKEEQYKIEQLKYKKAKLIVENKDIHEEYDTFLENQKMILSEMLEKRKIIYESFLFKILFIAIYIFTIFIFTKPDYINEDAIKVNMFRMSLIVLTTFLIIEFVILFLYRNKIKGEYKNIIKRLENLFLKITEKQRESVENIQLTKKLIKSKKAIHYMQELLDKANMQSNAISLQKINIRNYKNFCELIAPNIILDGSININDLDSSYNIKIEEKVSYKNKTYSFLDYIVFNKYTISFKNANTSRIVKKENAGTYISYVSIE